jgi:formylglycine-generating enzyme required for sulfatase activity/tRNA A-37 threonylcarbamoyl transferase component Bud32
MVAGSPAERHDWPDRRRSAASERARTGRRGVAADSRGKRDGEAGGREIIQCGPDAGLAARDPGPGRAVSSPASPKSFGRNSAYRVVGTIGRGGFATVYKAYHAALDRHVAIKVLRPEMVEPEGARQRFQAEARASARLAGHPNIVTVYDYGEEAGSAYLVLQLVEGLTLEKRLATPISAQEIDRIITGVASALDFAHRHNLIHRDIKPSNVLLESDGTPILSDFGIAKLLDATASMTNTLLGTPDYMSPEQITGAPLDARSDVYSLGVMVYRIFAGRPPFQGVPMSILHQHIHSPVPPISPNPVTGRPVPAAVEQVIQRALAKRPDDRPATAGQFADQLRLALKPMILADQAQEALRARDLMRAEGIVAELIRDHPSYPQGALIQREVARLRTRIAQRTRIAALVNAQDWQAAVEEIERLGVRGDDDPAMVELVRTADAGLAAERARQEAARQEAARQEAARRAELERQRQEALAAERRRQEALEAERREREAREAARREQEAREAARRQEEAREAERRRLLALEAERQERERRERAERERQERERAERAERARLEALARRAAEEREQAAQELETRAVDRPRHELETRAVERPGPTGFDDEAEGPPTPPSGPLPQIPVTRELAATASPALVDREASRAAPSAVQPKRARGPLLAVGAIVVVAILGIGALVVPGLLPAPGRSSPTATPVAAAQPTAAATATAPPLATATAAPAATPAATPATPTQAPAQAKPAATPPSVAPTAPPPTTAPQPTPVQPAEATVQPSPTAPPALPTRITARDGAEMALVAAGPFTMGDDGDPSAAPKHTLTLPAFYVDLVEVTNARFKQFVDQSGFKPQGSWRQFFDQTTLDPRFFDAERGEHPVVNVTWNDASAYCQWAGKRLPVEAEWEKAARGEDARRWPWGNEPHPELANVENDSEGEPDTKRVGSLPNGASPYGLLDMTGNAREWTDSPLLSYPLANPTAGAEGATSRVTRGGSWLSLPNSIELTRRLAEPVDTAAKDLGFRCAVSADQATGR